MSCVAQFLLITCEIFKSFDCNPSNDIRGTFLYILKAFVNVWSEGFIYKLETYDVDGSLLKLSENYSTGHQQRLLVNSQTSSWQSILRGICHSSVLDQYK